VETASGHIFRLATDPAVFERYEKESRLLPFLGARGLPCAVPLPRWLLPPSEAFPYGGIGYRKVAGAPITPGIFAAVDQQRLALDVARMMRALHSIAREELAGLGLPERNLFSAVDTAERDRSLLALRDVLDDNELAEVARWWDGFIADEARWLYGPVLVHADMTNENLLLDAEGHLCGVIDFEHASVQDPASDFMPLRFFSLDFQQRVLAAYVDLGGTLDDGVQYRMQRRFERAWMWDIRRDYGRDEMKPRAEVLALLHEHGVLR
jgi:aminoglycoside phosphotransferase (APT) family kinase protein